ncbi:hypothetical protein EXIGLDRAFT_735299, partial [Exidia glandulosa HHB12029]
VSVRPAYFAYFAAAGGLCYGTRGLRHIPRARISFRRSVCCICSSSPTLHTPSTPRVADS